MKRFFALFFFLFLAAASAQNDQRSSDNLSFMQGSISITIGGDFLITGTYPALITERVDQFITRMFNQARDRALANVSAEPFMIERVQKELEEYSIRNILLKRVSGEEIRIDLLKFRRTGDFTLNPYLKNDDVILFSPADLEKNFFSVMGAVNKPGKFHFVDGDKLSDAIELAYGINKAYENVEKVELHRLSYDGEKMDIITLNINDDFELIRGDRILVVADESQRVEFNVIVLGEVNRPGIIPITRNNTTLREVIEQVGGYTAEASLKKTRLFRGTRNIRFVLEREFGLDLENIEEYLRGWPNPLLFEYEKNTMLRMSTLTEEDTAFFVVDEQLRQMVHEAAMDFSDVLSENSESGNLRVKDGDIIIIPAKLHTIYVYGQVANPGLIKYAEGKDYKYFIDLAGGLGELAEDEDEIVIIKGDTREWKLAINHPYSIAPGDYIYVPKNPNRSFNYYVGQFANYLSIVGSAATIILLLIQFNK
jgi:protein involved in polysaccharide export with SLBB domain